MQVFASGAIHSLSVLMLRLGFVFLLLLASFGINTSSASSNPDWVPDIAFQGGEQNIGTDLIFLEDPDNNFTLGSILAPEQGGASDYVWQRSQKTVPNFGYTDSTYWFRFNLLNKQDDEASLFLALAYPLLDQVDVFFVQQGSVVERFYSGDTRTFESRPVHHRKFLFPLTLAPEEQVEVLMRVRSEGAMQVPLSVYDQAVFYQSDQKEMALKDLYYGMMLVMVLYNFFIFLSVRERAYLYYVGFVSCFAIMQAAMHGIAFQYFFPAFPQVHQLSVLFFVPATMLFACLFAISFLNLAQVAPRLYRLFQVMTAASFGCVLGAFVLPYAFSTQMSVFLVVASSLLMLISGPVAWYWGQKSARFYTYAWLLLLIGTSSTALSKFGILPSNLFTEYGLMFGSAFEAVLLSFALADRLNHEREARYQAQENQLKEARHRVEVEEKLHYLTRHDAYTGLANQVPLFERMERLMRGSDTEQHFALVKFCVGRWDEINKTLGQHCADRILKLFAERLRLCVSALDGLIPVAEGSEIAHYSRVDFACLLDLRKSGNLRYKIEKLREDLSETIEYQEMMIDPGIQIGVAIYPDHSTDSVELVKQAQIAMGFDALTGNIFDHQLNPYNERRLGLMGELQNAIEQNQLSLHFQPQIDVRTGKVAGAEALVRWQHPVYGNIPPMEFIPHAEQTGVIKHLTHWVFNHALFACKQLRDAGRDLVISINISAANLHEAEIVKNIQILLNKHEVAPDRLKIEITETAVMLDPKSAMKVLTRLHDLGVKIAIDDFGTGHSSLNYIKQLPADEIKIDRSFISDMVDNNDDEVIVSTTINMCHSLGYTVVAEGIENPATLEKLSVLDCDIAQGYYHCRPLAFDDFQSWLSQSDSKRSAS